MSIVSLLLHRLKKAGSGQVLPTVHNAILIAEHMPEIRQCLAYDEFARRTVVTQALPSVTDTAIASNFPRPLAPHDITAALSWYQALWSPQFSRETVHTALEYVARANSYHPVRDYLSSLQWDGIQRAEKWLTAAFAAENTPYTRAVGKIYLIGAVRRILEPGCKHDTIMVLDGPQGIGKSRALATLHGPQWTTDCLPPDLASRDAAMALSGVWCVELAELDHLLRNELETLKAFLSRTTDRYRAPYDRLYTDMPRQCIFAGTSNRRDYLRDDTGNRRFHPISVTHADIEWITIHRDQLWAEAVYLAQAGEENWLPTELTQHADLIARKYMPEDPWHHTIANWLEEHQPPIVTTTRLLRDALSLPISLHDRRAALRVGRIMRDLGWHTRTVRQGRKVQWAWITQKSAETECLSSEESPTSEEGQQCNV